MWSTSSVLALVLWGALTLLGRSRLALALQIAMTMGRFPSLQAMCSGVLPWRSCWSRWQWCLRRQRTTSTWHLRTARWRAVCPSWRQTMEFWYNQAHMISINQVNWLSYVITEKCFPYKQHSWMITLSLASRLARCSTRHSTMSTKPRADAVSSGLSPSRFFALTRQPAWQSARATVE